MGRRPGSCVMISGLGEQNESLGLDCNQTGWAGSNQTNLTAIEVPAFSPYIRAACMFFCIVILGIGVVGNVMVPLVIVKTKDMRNSTNIFLINLSIADLMVLLVCTPTFLVEVYSKPGTWDLGEEMCKAVPFVELTVAHASVLTILAISFERYYAICEPLRAGYVCTKTRATLICLLAWAFAAITTSPVLWLSEYQQAVYPDGTLVPVCWALVETFWPSLFFILSISLFFVVPLGVLIILYSVIGCHLMANPGLTQTSSALRYRRQVVLMLGTVVVAFFVCLLPFRAFTLCTILASSDEIVSIGVENVYYIMFFCRIMMFVNSAVNPVLYNLMSSKFREGFRRLMGLKGERDVLARKGTITTSMTPTSSARKASSDHLLKSSVVRVISLEDGKTVVRPRIDNGSSLKLLHHHNSVRRSEEGYV